jgi:hypothetical protein
MCELTPCTHAGAGSYRIPVHPDIKVKVYNFFKLLNCGFVSNLPLKKQGRELH